MERSEERMGDRGTRKVKIEGAAESYGNRMRIEVCSARWKRAETDSD